MMWLTSFSGFNCRWWPSCPGWPPVLRPDGSLLRRGFACGGSDDGGFEEFRDVCLSRASRFASRCSSSVTSTRTATGVAVQSSVLIPGGGPTSCIVAVVLITNLPLRQSRIPTLSGYDERTKEIIAVDLTESRVHDRQRVSALLQQIPDPIEQASSGERGVSPSAPRTARSPR
jgi:hypothetical protein